MPTPSKRKGDKFENELVHWLQDRLGTRLGLDFYRGKAGAERDLGDIFGLHEWTLQAKNYTNKALSSALNLGVKGLAVQRAFAKTPFGAVLVKRPGTSDVGKTYVVFELEEFAELLLAMYEGVEGEPQQ